MLTAIINARCGSSRLKYKHFRKIGDRSIIEIILDNLKKNKYIKDIYLATGPYSLNKEFKIKLKKKYKKLKFYFHNNEDKVTERIYYLTKKVKTKYTLLISGDCVLVDNSFIERLYKKLILNEKYDFIKTNKKVQHEGIKLFKTNAWKDVNSRSKSKIFQENPGYIIKKKSKLFKIIKLDPMPYEVGKISRLSVDTDSDIDFFEMINNHLRTLGKSFTFENASKYNLFKKYKYLNDHVFQKKPDEKIKRKVFIVTCQNKKFGFGHFKRSQIIKREINERITSNIKTYLIESNKVNKNGYIINLNKKKLISILKKNKHHLFIFDLPKPIINKISKILKNLKYIIMIDQKVDNKNAITIIPAARLKSKRKESLFAGKNYLFLNRNINKLNELKKLRTRNNKKILTFGATFYKNSSVENLIKQNKYISVILGKYVNNRELNIYRRLKPLEIIFNPHNYLEIISLSKKIYCKFGISTYEFISLGKKPTLFFENEKDERLKELMWLKKNNYINKYGEKEIINYDIKKLNPNKCLNNISKLISKKLHD